MLQFYYLHFCDWHKLKDPEILEFRLFGYYSFLATKIQVYLQFPLSQLSQSKLRTHTNDWKTVSWLCKIKPIKSFILPGKQSQQIESTFLKYSLFNNVKLTESQTSFPKKDRSRRCRDFYCFDNFYRRVFRIDSALLPEMVDSK